MRRLIPILVFIFASVCTNAQNWNPFTPGVNRYFTNAYHYLRGMKIDSITTVGFDTHYFPFKTRRGPNNGAFYPTDDTAGSWLGEDVIGKQGGNYIFPNYWGDTVLIKTLGNVGDTWLFYHDSSTVYYNAEIVAADTLTILGTLDSVKTILLTAFDNGNPLTTDSFNNTQIVLSKDHGFYMIIDIYLFPYHAPGSTAVVDDYYLANATKPVNLYYATMNILPQGPYSAMFKLIDFIDPSPAQMNDWNVGDVMEYSRCVWAYGTTSACYEPYEYWLDTVIAKNVTTAGVEYILSGWYAHHSNPYPYVLGVHTDTVFYSANGSAFGNIIPEDYLNSQGLLYYFPQDTSYCYTADMYYSYSYAFAISYFQEYVINKAGIGLKHQNNYDASNGQLTYDVTLQYFVKNGVPCGTFVLPDTTLSVSNAYLQNNIKVYPNPAYEQLNIETSLSDYTVSVINTIGQVVYSKKACINKQAIDIRSLADGVYYLKLETSKHEIVNQKITIQH